MSRAEDDHALAVVMETSPRTTAQDRATTVESNALAVGNEAQGVLQYETHYLEALRSLAASEGNGCLNAEDPEEVRRSVHQQAEVVSLIEEEAHSTLAEARAAPPPSSVFVNEGTARAWACMDQETLLKQRVALETHVALRRVETRPAQDGRYYTFLEFVGYYEERGLTREQVLATWRGCARQRIVVAPDRRVEYRWISELHQYQCWSQLRNKYPDLQATRMWIRALGYGDNCCYLLCGHGTSVAYIGTTETERVFLRLRQHNGEARGGATRTRRNRPWYVALIVHGFYDQSDAQTFEYKWQNPSDVVRAALLEREPPVPLTERLSDRPAEETLAVLDETLQLRDYSRRMLVLKSFSGGDSLRVSRHLSDERWTVVNAGPT